MVQAAAEGIIDFSEMEFRGSRWSLRLSKLLGHLHDRNRREQLDILHRANSGFIASGILTSRSFDSLKEFGTRLYDEIVDTYYPSMPKTPVIDPRSVEVAQTMWEGVYGSLDDPEVMSRVEAEASRMMAQHNHNKAAEQKVNQF